MGFASSAVTLDRAGASTVSCPTDPSLRTAAPCSPAHALPSSPATHALNRNNVTTTLTQVYPAQKGAIEHITLLIEDYT